MAKFYLINTTQVGSYKYVAGDEIDDAIDPKAAIEAAGGICWPSADATVAARATLVQGFRASKAINEAACDQLMLSSAASSLRAQTAAPLSNVAPVSDAQAAAAGVGTAASREDHVHPDPQAQDPGANLTDADATIQIAGGTWRVLPAATLGAGRALTLGTTNAVAGDRITITRLDVTANTYTIVNGGAGAGNLLVMPVSKVNFGVFQFDGTNWRLKACGTQ